MNRPMVLLSAVALLVNGPVATSFAKKLPQNRIHFESTPANTFLPPDLAAQAAPPRAAAVADTFVLAHFSFETPTGQPDEMGFTHVDQTDQTGTFFHVADGTELNGGQFGNLLPLSGNKSMWCGQAPSTAVPFCGYATLPGYGNSWDQILQADFASADSVTFSYDVFWDSEGDYDWTVVEYTFNGGATRPSWSRFPITDSLSSGWRVYDNTGIPGGITESFSVSGEGGINNLGLRFRFTSDAAWSDEDGLWQTDGAIIVDNIHVEYFENGASVGSYFQDFESAATGSNTAGIWTGQTPPAFGDFASLYPGVMLVQEDPCTSVNSYVWAFFDDPLNSNYGCAGHPEQGAIPHGNVNCDYISNRVESPLIPYTGSGDEVWLRFLVYRDLPLDNLVFYRWAVRSWVDGCPAAWQNAPGFVYYGSKKDWHKATFSIGQMIDPDASHIQVAVGVFDGCPLWCLFGCSGAPEGSCRGGSPYFDDIRVERIDNSNPQYAVRHINLFQDNFASDGTLTGAARADAALDILPSSSPGITPGDSVVITVAPVGPHTGAEGGPAVYTYVTVQPFGQTGKTPADLEAPELRGGSKRYPLVGTTIVGGVTWAKFRMDSAFTASGTNLADQYAIDLNDNVLTPGDTVHYFFCADASGATGDESYFSRRLDGQGANFVTTDIGEALASPMEFTILPAGGYNRGGEVLYVDDTDDRGGPAQLLFDSAFEWVGNLIGTVDRYDVLGPSSAAGNGLASRVTNKTTQIIDVYEAILWNTGDLASATIGDGTGNPEKSDDFGLLFQFLDTSALGYIGPGLYISGDDLAEEWVQLAGPGAVALRGTYMNFNLLGGSHISHGESVSPTLTARGGAGPWGHGGRPDKLVAYGGCPMISDFDVLQPTGGSETQWPYPESDDGAVLSQRTANAVGDTATVVLSGFSYHHIYDATRTIPSARAEFLRDLMYFFGFNPGIVDGIPDHGSDTALYNNYPNPFNPVTTIRYSIKERAHVSLEIYNAAGQLVKTLVNQIQAPDDVRPVTWDGLNNKGENVSSGVYFYRMVTKDFSQTKKMVLLK